MTRPLRPWQEDALTRFTETWPTDHLVTATPGAGKTTFALAAARAAFDARRVRRLIVVTPTDHLRTQWVTAAQEAGFDLRPTPNNERLPKDADGVVATYAQVAAAPQVFGARARTTRTLVVFDELHHAGDQNSWGEAVTDSFDAATHRLGITGTPFRSDTSRIPTVTYRPLPPPAEPGTVESVADFTYGYADALRDHVVRPVTFAAYSGATSWSSSAGEVYEALLGDPQMSRKTEDQAWRAALSTDGEWVPHVFAAMDGRLRELRSHAIPDAAALVLAPNQDTARTYADIWEAVNGYRPLLILSDDPESSRSITQFREDSTQLAAVSVRMVSEGVDVPRAAVLGFCTTASTPLFFAQAVGRVVRSRRRGEQATVFLPAVTKLLGLAAAMEDERNHVLPAPTEGDLDVEVPDPEPPIDPPTDSEDEPAWKVIEATASFHDVIPGSRDYSPDGVLPGLLTADQEKQLLAKHDEHARAAARRAHRAKEARVREERTAHEAAVRKAQFEGGLEELIGQSATRATRIEDAAQDVADMRRTIAARVRARASRRDVTPQQVWGELYRTVPGPRNSQATVRTLTRRMDATADW